VAKKRMGIYYKKCKRKRGSPEICSGVDIIISVVLFSRYNIMLYIVLRMYYCYYYYYSLSNFYSLRYSTDAAVRRTQTFYYYWYYYYYYFFLLLLVLLFFTRDYDKIHCMIQFYGILN
jgi:hypothetical protein